jgi:hypothetical protein
MAPRNPKNPIKDISDAVGGWLGGNRGTINPQVARVSRDLGTVAQTIDTFTGGFGAAAGRDVRNFAQGGSLPTNVAKTAAVNLAAGAVGAKAAQVVAKAGARAASNVAAKVNPFYGTVRTARTNAPDWARGEATAEELMKLRSADRFNFDSTVRTPPRIKDDTAHLANIRKQNKSSYEYENKTRLYSDEDLSNFSNLSEDIKTRGIQQPVTIGRIAGKPTLLEGNHRVIAQFDINPKAKVPFEVSQNTWDVVNKQTKDVARRTRAKVPKK